MHRNPAGTHSLADNTLLRFTGILRPLVFCRGLWHRRWPQPPSPSQRGRHISRPTVGSGAGVVHRILVTCACVVCLCSVSMCSMCVQDKIRCTLRGSTHTTTVSPIHHPREPGPPIPPPPAPTRRGWDYVRGAVLARGRRQPRRLSQIHCTYIWREAVSQFQQMLFVMLLRSTDDGAGQRMGGGGP